MYKAENMARLFGISFMIFLALLLLINNAFAMPDNCFTGDRSTTASDYHNSIYNILDEENTKWFDYEETGGNVDFEAHGINIINNPNNWLSWAFSGYSMGQIDVGVCVDWKVEIVGSLGDSFFGFQDLATDGDGYIINDGNDCYIAVPSDGQVYLRCNGAASNSASAVTINANEIHNYTLCRNNTAVYSLWVDNTISTYMSTSFGSVIYQNITIMGNAVPDFINVTYLSAWNMSEGCPSGAAPPTDATPPGLLDSYSWCTSCSPVQQITDQPWKTDDTTPTINATTNESATGAIIGNDSAVGNYNYTDIMNVHYGAECTTTGSTDHICTVPDNQSLSIGYPRYVCVGFKDGDDNELLNATLCAEMNITDATAPTITANKPTEDEEFTLDINNTILFNWTVDDNHYTSYETYLSINGTLHYSNTSYNNATNALYTTSVDYGVWQTNITAIDNESNRNTYFLNFTVINDSILPIVNLIAPANNSYFLIGINETVTFKFNFTDNINNTADCTSYIGGVTIYTNTSTLNGTNTSFIYTVTIGSDQKWNVTCIDPYNNQNSSIRYFTVEQSTNVTISLDGVVADRKYEFRSKLNISANCTSDDGGNCSICINLTAPGYGYNYSCGDNSTSFIYNITILRQDKFNDSTSIKTLTSHTTPSLSQENANKSSCEGVWSGSYPCENTDDGNWNSRGLSRQGYNGTTYRNLSVPAKVIDLTKWEVGDLCNRRTKLDLDDCWNSTLMRFKMVSDFVSGPGGEYGSYYYCWDGSQWLQLRYCGMRSIYEDRIIWEYNLTTETLGIDMDNNSDLISSTINLSSAGTSSNISINYYGNSKSYEGDLIGKYIKQTEFLYQGEYETSVNISYTTAGADYIYVTVPDNVNNFSFEISGFDLDQLNEFSYTEHFNKSANINMTLNNSDAPLGYFEDFEVNNSKWTYSGTGKSRIEYSNGYLEIVADADSYIYSTYNDQAADMKDTSYITSINYYKVQVSGCQSDCPDASSATVKLYATDGTDRVELYEEITSCVGICGGTTIEQVYNFTLEKTASDYKTWVLYRNESSQGTKDLSSLDFDQQIKLEWFASNNEGSHSVDARWRLHDLFWGGAWLNRYTNNGTYRGVGNFTSSVIQATTTNVSRAILTCTDYNPTGTDIDYFLSNDCTNFEKVTSGLLHVFTTVGNHICWRANLSSTLNTTSPVVRHCDVDVTSAAVENVTIDLEDDGTDEWSYIGKLNTTSSPKVVNFTIGSGYQTIKIATATPGQIQVNNLDLNSSMNPVSLNDTLFEDCDNCEFDVVFNGDNIDVDGIEFDFYGSWNYTATASYSTDRDTHTISVYYSDFNASLPNNIDYYDVFPASKDSKNVTPYGQSDNTPIWNTTNKAYEKDIDVYVKTNTTINSCMNITWANSSNRSGATNNKFVLNTSYQSIITDLPVNDTIGRGLWNWWDFYNCTSGAYFPWFYFAAVCNECVFDINDLDNYNIIVG